MYSRLQRKAMVFLLCGFQNCIFDTASFCPQLSSGKDKGNRASVCHAGTKFIPSPGKKLRVCREGAGAKAASAALPALLLHLLGSVSFPSPADSTMHGCNPHPLVLSNHGRGITSMYLALYIKKDTNTKSLGAILSNLHTE